jgi:aminoglycoside phosphotransferase (APT) family kinase protein
MRKERPRVSESEASRGELHNIADSHLELQLSAYLSARISRFRKLGSGWQTDVFEFEIPSLNRCASLPAGQPLILKIYQAGMLVDKCAREAWAMRRLKDAGYPVPRTYLFEGDHVPLGSPFLIMERVRGRPLFAFDTVPKAVAVFVKGFVPFARVHAALHLLNAQIVSSDGELGAGNGNLGSKSPPLLDRMLTTIAEQIEQAPLPALNPALEWVSSNAVRFRSGPNSILHLDYLPRNVIVDGVHITGVLDWIGVDVGDRHLDAATTAVILRTSATGQHRLLRDHAFGNTLRMLCAATYVTLYHSLFPLDLRRFRYYQSVAALHRLAMLSFIRTRGPESAGFRPGAIAEVTPAVLRHLASRVARLTGVSLATSLRI